MLLVIVNTVLIIGTIRLVVLWVLNSKASEAQEQFEMVQRVYRRESETGSLLASARKRS